MKVVRFSESVIQFDILIQTFFFVALKVILFLDYRTWIFVCLNFFLFLRQQA